MGRVERCCRLCVLRKDRPAFKMDTRLVTCEEGVTRDGEAVVAVEVVACST